MLAILLKVSPELLIGLSVHPCKMNKPYELHVCRSVFFKVDRSFCQVYLIGGGWRPSWCICYIASRICIALRRWCIPRFLLDNYGNTKCLISFYDLWILWTSPSKFRIMSYCEMKKITKKCAQSFITTFGSLSLESAKESSVFSWGSSALAAWVTTGTSSTPSPLLSFSGLSIQGCMCWHSCDFSFLLRWITFFCSLSHSHHPELTAVKLLW